MKQLTPLSEDFLYWDPEEILHYPNEKGIEDEWFIRPPQVTDKKEKGEVIYVFC